jgi:DNA-binding transcriptional MerR regulator
MSRPDVHDNLMPIGAFARRTRLSLKALRLYDELGLLAPASVDQWTGYRAYSESQIASARLIRLLRGLDMPLERIRPIVSLPSREAATEVRAFWREVDASHAVKSRLVAFVERYLEGKGDAMFAVSTREVPAQAVVSMTRAVTVKDLVPFLMEAHDRLSERLTAAGAQPDQPWFVIYHGEVNEDSDGPVEVCLPYRGSSQPTADDEVGVRIEPAHREAFTTISRAQTQFPEILDAYAAVEHWIDESGATPAAPPREVYFVDQTQIQPEDPFCDISFPITSVAVPATP